jgi:hypothetical protein
VQAGGCPAEGTVPIQIDAAITQLRTTSFNIAFTRAERIDPGPDWPIDSLTAMVGLDPPWLAAHGIELAEPGVVPGACSVENTLDWARNFSPP